MINYDNEQNRTLSPKKYLALSCSGLSCSEKFRLVLIFIEIMRYLNSPRGRERTTWDIMTTISNNVSVWRIHSQYLYEEYDFYSNINVTARPPWPWPPLSSSCSWTPCCTARGSPSQRTRTPQTPLPPLSKFPWRGPRESELLHCLHRRSHDRPRVFQHREYPDLDWAVKDQPYWGSDSPISSPVRFL